MRKYNKCKTAYYMGFVFFYIAFYLNVCYITIERGVFYDFQKKDI